jgi:copper(I)-binding protein
MLLRNTRIVGWPMLIFCCTLVLLAACTDATPNTSSELQIALLPAAGGVQGTTMGVQLADANGMPITDATVTLEGNMNHAGMVPVMADAVTDEADGTADGIYQVPFQFSMLGDWIVTVTVEKADGSTITRDITATVGANEVTTDVPMIMGDTDHSEMDQDAMSADAMAPDPVAEPLMVSNVFVGPAPLAGGNGAVYLSIHNGTDVEEQLLSLTTDVADAAELHETVNDNNVMRMEARPEGFAIPAGGELALEPGGKHIMLVNLHQPLAEGDTVSLTLNFAHAAPMMLEVTVGSDEAIMLMGESGMDHSQHDMDAMDTTTPTATD